ERTSFEVWQQHGRDARIVVDHLRLGESGGGIHDFLQVAERELATLNLDFRTRGHASGIEPNRYMLPAGGVGRQIEELSQHPLPTRHPRWSERRRDNSACEFLTAAPVPARTGGTVPRGAAAPEREAGAIRCVGRIRAAGPHWHMAEHEGPRSVPTG